MVGTRTRDFRLPPPKKPPAALKAGKKSKGRHIDKRVPCTKFVLFQRLPCEVRLMIWEASMTPRIVAVRPRMSSSFRDEFQAPHLKKTHPAPAQLSVNMESRQCALRRYSLRFTITLSIDQRGNHRLVCRNFDTTGYHERNCPKFYITKYHANVVMSPDDTLGLLGWHDLNLSGDCTWFQVENASPVGCFGVQRHIPTYGIQPEVKKVALLGRGIGYKPEVLHILNSKVSCDMNSLLHGEHTSLSKFLPPRGSWYGKRSYIPYTKEYVWIQSRNFDGSLQEWLRRMLYRSETDGYFALFGPDILAFELEKEPEEFTMPTELVQQGDCLEDPEGYYFTREWEWRQTHPCPQGF